EVTTTGEQMHLTAPVLALFRRLPQCTLHNHYGPSESHVVTAYTLPGDPDLWVPHPPIGGAIDNTRLLVLDASMNLCPVGVPGELYIGGLCLARGYWNRPALTAERFISDPHSDDPTARLYRSGDIARWRPDGTIEYMGRRDDQVKIRGVRVEIGEVESSISRHPDVLETIVLAREDRPGERRLVAYVVMRSAGTGLAELRAFLRQSLPEVMIPAAIVPMSALPLTGNGKIDRRALPAPEDVTTPRTTPLVAPRSEIEAALASIWREVLRVDRLGVHDDFFELGGHSLAATQVFSRVRRIFGVELSFARLFTLPTIAALAAWIRAERASGPDAGDTIARAPRDRPVPLSSAQERLWFLHKMAPGSVSYHCPYFFRVGGPLDVAALQRAFDGLFARHEVLRTTFHEAGGRPLQVISRTGTITLERIDLTLLAPDDRAAQLRSCLDREGLRPFDLERGPLLRAGLVRVTETEHVLWLNMHHIILDGWSMDVLLRELAALYTGDRSLPEPALQYADYAIWERARSERDLSQAVAWWRAKLAGAPALLALPGDRPRPPVPSSRGGSVRFHLEKSQGEALRALGVKRGLTLAMVMFAGYVALLHRYTGEHDLVIGIPTSGRDRVELEPLIGLFVNTLPVRVDLSGDPSFLELLDQVRAVCLEAYDHDNVPFDRLVQELAPQRSIGHNPLVQIGFAPQPAGERDLRLAGLEVEALEIDAAKTVFDLALYTWEDSASITGLLEYSVDLFDRETIDRMRDHLVALLCGAVAEPDRKVSSIALAPVDKAGPRAATGPVAHELMHTLFEQHAARNPGHPAIVLGDARMSHAMLDERADLLARHLRARGVGAETLVALSVERSFDLIVGVLAILKAGGAFVPLDPEYPADRLAFMLEDSAAPVVLTQAKLADNFKQHRCVIRLDADWAEIARAPGPVPRDVARPDNAAYVIYTSGSTGRPKGVVVEHRNAVNLAHAQRAMYGLTAASVVLQFASLSFDAFVSELLSAWAVGATLCLLPPGLAVPGREFTDILRRQQVSLFALPPSLLAVLPVESLPALTHVVSGGEPCSAEVVDRWAPGRTFLNVYGPTEATVCASFARCQPGAGVPPIGGPLANVQLYVLDAGGHPAPVGVPGELYIGGAGVARGYLNRPELTHERFVADPFVGEAGARMYRTGDRVRVRGDGQLEFLGRLDQQIKLRGFRVELGEVEAALRAHPGVQDAAVIVGTDLVAFVVPGAVVGSTDAQDEHVDAWRAVNDETYAGPTVGEATLDITGWTSSHTGLPIPAEVMRVWRDSTVDRIAALPIGPARRVWEIGCGSG
ncbi:MAG TPA: amino acid adenylation domain-containing protein, partial [Nannocystis sp.]